MDLFSAQFSETKKAKPRGQNKVLVWSIIFGGLI